MKKFRWQPLMVILLFTGTVWAQDKEIKPEQQPEDVVATVVSPARAKLIRKLLDLLPATPGGTGQTNQTIDLAVDIYRKQLANVPEKVWQEITLELRKEFTADRIAEALAPIYANHFSDREIKELTDFFSSPAGRKWSQVLPQLRRESFNAGDALGYSMGLRINEWLKARGYALSAAK